MLQLVATAVQWPVLQLKATLKTNLSGDGEREVGADEHMLREAVCSVSKHGFLKVTVMLPIRHCSGCPDLPFSELNGHSNKIP